MLKHFEENPLSPLIVVLLSGVYNSGPVKGKAYPFELTCEFFNIHIRNLARMNTGFDSVVFSRKTVSVKADRKKDVETLHPALS